MGWAEFRKNHLFPILGGLAVVVLQAVNAALSEQGLTVDLRQLGFSILSAAVGYFLTVSTRYWGGKEAWSQPVVEPDEVVFRAK